MINTTNVSRYLNVWAISLASIFLTGCISPPNVKFTHNESFDLLTTTSAESSIVILDKDNPIVFCSEPASNVSVNSDNAFSLSGVAAGQQGKASDSIGVKESALSASTGDVLLTREILYRACEFISNSNLSEVQKRDVFLKALEAVTSINKD
jgi:hypothetical protein